MSTMSPAPSRLSTRPRAAPASPAREPISVPDSTPPMKSPQLASLLDRVENAEREKREQDALALLGRLARFD